MMLSWHKFFIRSVAIAFLFTSKLIVTGWIVDSDVLKSIVTGLPAIKFNTAICFMFASLSLLLLTINYKITNAIQKTVTVIVLAISILALIPLINIDELFIKDNAARLAGNLHPGRIETSTAFSMILLSAAILFISLNKKRFLSTAQYLLHTVTLISFLVILQYLYKTTDFFTLPFFSSMVITSAVFFFFLSVAASFINYSLGFTGLLTGKRMGSVLARKIFPAIALIAILPWVIKTAFHWHILISPNFDIALFAISFTTISFLLVAYVTQYLNKTDESRTDAEESLKTLNLNLEETIDERMHELKTIFTGAPDAIVVIDQKGIIFQWNNQATNLFGWTEKEAVGLSLTETIIPEEYREAHKAGMSRFLTTGKSTILGTNVEIKAITKNKTEIYVALTISPVQMKDEQMFMGFLRDITKQKKQAEQIQQSEERYHSMVEGVHDYAIILLDENGNIQNWNKGAEKIKGYTENEIIGKNFRTFYTAEDQRNNIPDELLNTAKKEGKAHTENWRVRKDGSLFWGSVLISALYNPQNKITGFTKVTRDLTDAKKAEEAIKNNERKFQIMLEAIGDNAWEHDFISKQSHFSETIHAFIGFTSQEITDSAYTWWQLVHPDDRWMLEESDKKYKAGLAASHHLEYRIHHKNGDLKWVLDRGVIIEKDINGKPLKIVGTHTDITARKTAETSLDRIKKQFQSFMEHIPAMAWIVNKETIYQFTNHNYETTFYDNPQDAEHGQLIGKSFYELFSPETADIYKRNNDIVFDTNKVLETIEPSVDKAGNEIILKIFKFPLQISNAETLLGGIAIDITGLVKAEENLRMLNEKITTSNKDLEQFAYVASHDLQEPLRMVSSFMQLIEKKYSPQLDDTAKQYIHFAVDGAERMKKLILDLLSFSRIGTEIQFNDSVNLNDVISEAKLNLMALILETNTKIEVAQLPVIKANKVQIIQLFQNLLNNAIKYRSEKTPEIKIGYVEEASGYYRFYVKDNGIGIDNKYFEKIFIIFQRLHNRTAFSGTGIGLSICKKIAEKHNGYLTVESQLGEGSTFNFYLPKTKII